MPVTPCYYSPPPNGLPSMSPPYRIPISFERLWKQLFLAGSLFRISSAFVDASLCFLKDFGLYTDSATPPIETSSRARLFDPGPLIAVCGNFVSFFSSLGPPSPASTFASLPSSPIPSIPPPFYARKPTLLSFSLPRHFCPPNQLPDFFPPFIVST